MKLDDMLRPEAIRLRAGELTPEEVRLVQAFMRWTYTAGQRAEREACAQECERVRSVSAVSYETGSACAAAIRNRKDAAT